MGQFFKNYWYCLKTVHKNIFLYVLLLPLAFGEHTLKNKIIILTVCAIIVVPSFEVWHKYLEKTHDPN